MRLRIVKSYYAGPDTTFSPWSELLICRTTTPPSFKLIDRPAFLGTASLKKRFDQRFLEIKCFVPVAPKPIHNS